MKRKQTVGDDLLTAAARWIEANGGKALVIGGIQIQRWPGDREGIYYVAVRVLGRAPTPEAEKPKKKPRKRRPA